MDSRVAPSPPIQFGSDTEKDLLNAVTNDTLHSNCLDEFLPNCNEATAPSFPGVSRLSVDEDEMGDCEPMQWDISMTMASVTKAHVCSNETAPQVCTNDRKTMEHHHSASVPSQNQPTDVADSMGYEPADQNRTDATVGGHDSQALLVDSQAMLVDSQAMLVDSQAMPVSAQGVFNRVSQSANDECQGASPLESEPVSSSPSRTTDAILESYAALLPGSESDQQVNSPAPEGEAMEAEEDTSNDSQVSLAATEHSSRSRGGQRSRRAARDKAAATGRPAVQKIHGAKSGGVAPRKGGTKKELPTTAGKKLIQHPKVRAAVSSHKPDELCLAVEYIKENLELIWACKESKKYHYLHRFIIIILVFGNWKLGPHWELFGKLAQFCDREKQSLGQQLDFSADMLAHFCFKATAQFGQMWACYKNNSNQCFSVVTDAIKSCLKKSGDNFFDPVDADTRHKPKLLYKLSPRAMRDLEQAWEYAKINQSTEQTRLAMDSAHTP